MYAYLNHPPLFFSPSRPGHRCFAFHEKVCERQWQHFKQTLVIIRHVNCLSWLLTAFSDTYCSTDAEKCPHFLTGLALPGRRNCKPASIIETCASTYLEHYWAPIRPSFKLYKVHWAIFCGRPGADFLAREVCLTAIEFALKFFVCSQQAYRSARIGATFLLHALSRCRNSS